MTRVLFFRHFDAPSGGHSKLRDYFDHVRATPGFEAQIAFSDDSLWDESNPWWDLRGGVLRVSEWENYEPDLLFLEGTDWNFLPVGQRENPPLPILNLIQGLRHADPKNERSAFLEHPATRICVSPEVQAALEATGRVNGPIFTNTNGLDLASLPVSKPEREWDIVVAGAKHPRRARWIGQRLERLGHKSLGLLKAKRPGLRVKVLDGSLPRAEYLEIIASSRIAVLLPLEQEGFYLPALEAMAMRTVVVCPDVIGNRSFCHDGANCLFPPFDDQLILEAGKRALDLSEVEMGRLVEAGVKTAAGHTLERERAGFQRVLGTVLSGSNK